MEIGWIETTIGALFATGVLTLKEKARITGDWVRTPTGKSNVYNTVYDIS